MRRPERQEKLRWNFKFFNEAAVEASRELINLFISQTPQLRPGDKLDVTYTIYIDYLGEICERLRAIIELQKRGVCVRVDEQELKHGHCLIREAFEAIDQINGKIK